MADNNPLIKILALHHCLPCGSCVFLVTNRAYLSEIVTHIQFIYVPAADTHTVHVYIHTQSQEITVSLQFFFRLCEADGEGKCIGMFDTR